ncbi:unnamed protein product [Rhizophagus irregularis]|nr:unnamed protein product [Rhizophagus irregularis]
MLLNRCSVVLQALRTRGISFLTGWTHGKENWDSLFSTGLDVHKWSKQFKCDTLHCCYLHRLTAGERVGFLMGMPSLFEHGFFFNELY